MEDLVSSILFVNIMEKLISITDVNKLEDEYQEFYSYIVKYLHVPVSASDIVKNFYFSG